MASRILALDPGTRFMGLVVLEASELIYYGVKTFASKRPERELIEATRRVLSEHIKLFEPDILAFEQSFFAPSKSSALLRAQEREIRRIGKTLGLDVIGRSPAYVRQELLGGRWADKRTVAEFLVGRFPV